MKHDNIVWNFFSSVKLALFTLGCLSITSIFGTLIPQKESFDYYVQKYGVETANFLQLFDLTNMYTAWWFLLLLGLLSANLIVCSIERFPVVWRQIHKDNLDIPIEKLKKLGIENVEFGNPTDNENGFKNISWLSGIRGVKRFFPREFRASTNCKCLTALREGMRG